VADTRGNIDRFFDGLDGIADTLDRTINRQKPSPNKKTAKAQARPAPVTAAVLRQSKFHITEAIDSETSAPIFIVTDGKVRAECNSRPMAEKLLATLQAEAA
jgi:hypothetical protein